ncbi:MAG: thymidine phosphorylase [Oscillospiraceae bacterium]|nr:thymidine phosphorylase [Oscillospiraceae bacterium]
MLMTELIAKKRDGGTLSPQEIKFIVDGYTNGEIPDYQMSAMLMAMYFRGLNHDETVELTLAMMHSGEVIDLSAIDGVKADKHSTGGVGDKTSLVLCPLVACEGVKIAKMSGHGLGHTGGTLDKLESFPGLSVNLTPEQFLHNVNEVGLAIVSQTANVDPADKKLYALRDVTGTVAVQGLIVSSIMSKKLAAGADIIVLDVKCGSGSFTKTEESARSLAEEMVAIGRAAGKKAAAVITDMDEPLGYAVGNALEVKEAIACLSGEKCGELLELCLTLGGCILVAAGKAADMDAARGILLEGITSGRAKSKLAELVAAQGGDEHAVYDTSLLPSAPVQLEALSDRAGYVNHIQADAVGLVNLHLGGGRATKESVIDLSVGLVLHKKVGDRVERGESLATIHASTPEKAAEAAEMLRQCYTITDEKPQSKPFIKGVIV